MRRILIAECIHEVCSFNPAPTRISDFFIHSKQEMLQYHNNIRTEISGACGVFSEQADLQVVPTLSARGISSGGLLVATDWTQLARDYVAAFSSAGHVDGIYFCLHGALAAENELDPEGYLLAELRRIFGEMIPIVASYDLHGILTDRMLEHVDASVVYHTYPHVDFFETGERAARLLLKIMNGEVKPVTARVVVPALVRGDELKTQTGVFGKLVQQARDVEQGPNGLSAGLFIGNPFTDVPELGTSTLVVTDNDEELARKRSVDLANTFWQNREKMQASLTSLEESVRIATETAGTVILVDAADATSSGAPGDSNAILRQLMATGYTKRALIPIVDPGAVNAAFAAGVGKTMTTQVGGAFDNRCRPMEITAYVAMLSDGRFRSESFQQEWFADRTAVLELGNATLVVTTRPVHLFDRSLFYAHGQDPLQFDAVVVKSPHCQSHMFDDWCARLVNVDAPGATSANLRSLPYQVCPRPIFPLDAEVQFSPQPTLFRRKSGR